MLDNSNINLKLFSASMPPTRNQRNLILYALPLLVSRASGLFLLPFFTRILQPEEYGLVSLAIIVSSLLSLSVLPGLETVYLRYGFGGFKSTSESDNTRYYGSIVLIHLFLVFVLLPLFATLAWQIVLRVAPELPFQFFLISVISLGISSFQAPVCAHLRARQKVGQLAIFLSTVTFLNLLTVAMGLFVFQWKAVSLLLGDLASGLIVLPFCLPAIVRGIQHAIQHRHFSTPARAFLVTGPEVFAFWAFTAMDRFMLNRFHGPSEAGIYTAAYQFASMIVGLAIIANKQWQVLVYESVDATAGELTKIRKLYFASFRVFLNLSALLAILSLPLSSHFIGQKFRDAGTLIPILALIPALRIPLVYFANYCIAFQKRKVLLATHATAIGIYVFFCALLIPAWGAKGASWASVAGFGTYLIAIHLKKISLLRFSWNDLGPRSILSFAAIGMAFYVQIPEIPFAVAVALILLLAFEVKSYFAALGHLDDESI